MHYNFVFLASEGAGFNPLAFDPAAIILTLITFILSLLVLSRMCWRPILKAAQDREDRIDANLRSAEKAREDAEADAAQYKKQLDEAKAEVMSLIEDGRREAGKLKQDIVAKAHSEAEAARDRAHREIELAQDKAIAQLRAESVDLSIAIASKVLQRSLEDEDHKKIATEILEQI